MNKIFEIMCSEESHFFNEFEEKWDVEILNKSTLVCSELIPDNKKIELFSLSVTDNNSLIGAYLTEERNDILNSFSFSYFRENYNIKFDLENLIDFNSEKIEYHFNNKNDMYKKLRIKIVVFSKNYFLFEYSKLINSIFVEKNTIEQESKQE